MSKRRRMLMCIRDRPLLCSTLPRLWYSATCSQVVPSQLCFTDHMKVLNLLPFMSESWAFQGCATSAYEGSYLIDLLIHYCVWSVWSELQPRWAFLSFCSWLVKDWLCFSLSQSSYFPQPYNPPPLSFSLLTWVMLGLPAKEAFSFTVSSLTGDLHSWLLLPTSVFLPAEESTGISYLAVCAGMSLTPWHHKEFCF